MTISTDTLIGFCFAALFIAVYTSVLISLRMVGMQEDEPDDEAEGDAVSRPAPRGGPPPS